MGFESEQHWFGIESCDCSACDGFGNVNCGGLENGNWFDSGCNGLGTESVGIGSELGAWNALDCTLATATCAGIDWNESCWPGFGMPPDECAAIEAPDRNGNGNAVSFGLEMNADLQPPPRLVPMPMLMSMPIWALRSPPLRPLNPRANPLPLFA